MDDARRLLVEEAARVEPSRDGLSQTYRRIRRRRRRRRLAAGATGLLLTAVSVVIWSPWLGTRLTDWPDRSGSGLAPGSSGQGSIPESSAGNAVGGTLVDGAVGEGSAWALICEQPCSEQPRGRLLRLDPASGTVVGATPVDAPQAVAAGEGGVWVAGFANSTVTHLDPATGRVVATIHLELPFEVASGDRRFLPFDVVTGHGAVWVTSGRGALARIDPRTDQVIAMVRLPGDTTGRVAAGAGAVWVAENVLGVYRIDPASNAVVAKILVPGRQGPLAVGTVAVEDGAVWLAGEWTDEGHALSGTAAIVRLDPADNRPGAQFPAQPGQQLVTSTERSIWAVSSDGSTVSRIDAGSGRVVADLSLRPAERLIAVMPDALLTGDLDGRFRRIPLAG
jgi:virginiamycin B lyase